jgi:tetratricopeptide (TPR) repeat protein
MKTLTIIPLLLALCMLLLIKSVIANDDKYIEVMRKNIETVYSAQSPEELQKTVNSFERIGTTEKNKWEPFYYAAFGYIMMATREADLVKKDTYLDQALAVLKQAQAIVPAESEVVALEGFVHMIRVSVDPASRGQQYSGLAFQAFGKAVSLNPDNPRALSFLAQMQFGTAQFFGQPTTEACGTLNKALEKFESYKSENPLSPQWGKGMADDLKKQCP